MCRINGVIVFFIHCNVVNAYLTNIKQKLCTVIPLTNLKAFCYGKACLMANVHCRVLQNKCLILFLLFN